MDFPPHTALPAEERRLLDPATYVAWAAAEPRRLAGCLNTLAALRASGLSGHVRRLEQAEPSRIFVFVDPGLRAAVAAAGWLGPEDARLMHGRYDVSFREPRAYTSLQVCFAPDGQAEIDVDEENPAFGDPWATLSHLVRATRHRLLGQQSDPTEIRKALLARGIEPAWSGFPTGGFD